MITVYGGSKSQRKHGESMVEFCIDKFMPRIKDSLDIRIHFKDLSKQGAYGFCMADPDGDDARSDRPRTFAIEVHKHMRLRRIIEVIAHEMIHAKQYARGDLYQGTRTAKMRWQGKWVSDNLDYWDHPWEIEAHGREGGTFVQWAEKNNLGGRKWTYDTD
jgi:hypothetical protein